MIPKIKLNNLMQKHNILFNVLKDNKFFISFILSLLTHFLIFIIFQNNEDKLLGDNYVPIEISVINSSNKLGDTIQKSERKIINNLFKKEDNFKKKSQEKLTNKIEEKKTDDIKLKKKDNNAKESKLKEFNPSLEKNKKENKKIGTEKGIKKNAIEAGSIKGEGFQKVTCLNCIEPKYPKLAIQKGYEGVLKLKIFILKTGKVKEVSIKKSTGFTILDKAGVNAALNSSFYPLSKETTLNVEYILRLN